MKTFTNYTYLTEDTKASTYFEGVLVDCWNLSSNQTAFKKEILKSRNTKAFLALKKSGWATTGKTPKEQKVILWNLARLMHQKIPLSGNADKAGQNKLGVSTFWSKGKPRGYEGTGKGVDTSKADITIGTKGISVKGPSAQLMSGEQKEARATVISALDYTGGNEYVKKNLMREVNDFITSTKTYGAQWTATATKKATPAQIKASGNEKAREALDLQEETKRKTNEVFKKAFNTPQVAHAFAWEAMTGWEKFGGKTYRDPGSGREGEATAMLVFDKDMKKLIYHHITPKAPYVAKIAKEMRMAADIKSGHYNVKGVKAGYAFYQTVRLTYNTVFKKTDEFNEAYNHAVDKQHILLAEGKINEVKLKATLVKMKDWLMSKMKKLWDWAARMMTKLKERVIEILEQSVDIIMNFFDVKVNVTVKTTVRMM